MPVSVPVSVPWACLIRIRDVTSWKMPTHFLEELSFVWMVYRFTCWLTFNLFHFETCKQCFEHHPGTVLLLRDVTLDESGKKYMRSGWSCLVLFTLIYTALTKALIARTVTATLEHQEWSRWMISLCVFQYSLKFLIFYHFIFNSYHETIFSFWLDQNIRT